MLTKNDRTARDSKPLEVLGTYNPLPQRPTNLSTEEARKARAYKEIALDRSRAKYWLGVGAQPTDTAWRLMELVFFFFFFFFFFFQEVYFVVRDGWLTGKRLDWRNPHQRPRIKTPCTDGLTGFGLACTSAGDWYLWHFLLWRFGTTLGRLIRQVFDGDADAVCASRGIWFCILCAF